DLLWCARPWARRDVDPVQSLTRRKAAHHHHGRTMTRQAPGRAVAIALLAGGLGLTLSLGASQEPRRWVALDGRDWTQFSPKEKQAYVSGFLAGSAGAGGGAGAARDTALIRQTVDSLFRSGALQFPF